MQIRFSTRMLIVLIKRTAVGSRGLVLLGLSLNIDAENNPQHPHSEQMPQIPNGYAIA